MSPLTMVMRSRTAVRTRFPALDDANDKRDVIIRLSYFLLQQVDLLLTLWAVNSGFTEMNPLMRNMLSSPTQLITFKIMIPLLIAWFCPSKLLLPSLGLILAVTLWNMKEVLFMLF